MLAQFDGKCYQCGGTIMGSKDHSEHEAHKITWARRTKAGEPPAKRKWIHVSPTCDEVSRGIMLRDEVRGGAVASEPDEAAIEATAAEAEAVAPSAPDTSAVTASVLAALRAAGVAIPDAAVKAAASVAAVATKTIKKMTAGSWWDVLKALLLSKVRRILLVGPPGTGKSTTAQLVDGAKTYRITMTEGTGVEDVLGMFQLVSDGKGGTETKWVDGPATLAMREGVRLQIDEITHCPAEMQSLMYGLMDDDPQIMLPNGEHLKAAPGYTLIATTNDNPQELPDALMSRCEAILLATIPHPDSLKDCGAGAKAACLNYYRGIDVTPWKFSRHPAVREVRSFERIKAAGYLSDELIAAAVFGDAGKEFLSTISTAAAKPPIRTAR